MEEIKIPFTEIEKAPDIEPALYALIESALSSCQKTTNARKLNPQSVILSLKEIYDLGIHGAISAGIVIDWDANASTFPKSYFIAARGNGTPDSTHIRVKMYGKGVTISFFRAKTARQKMKIEEGREAAAECVLRKTEKRLRYAYKNK